MVQKAGSGDSLKHSLSIMSSRAIISQGYIPPHYTIDLSLPPRQRYKVLATEYKSQLQALTSLFDQLLLDFALPPSWLPTINRLSKLTMRRIYDSEQTEELRGIADVTGIPMYLLVAFNSILDLLMGCTSGAVRVCEFDRPESQTRMLHFRTLDWLMDPLRKIVVQLDFIRTNSAAPTQVLASSITYIGFVGVLTGVRPGLSMSLNFRALHNATTRSAHFRFYFHHVLVLFGRRPSIAGLLRNHLMENLQSDNKDSPDIADVTAALQSKHTTAAYLILSDGDQAITMEKDFSTAKVRSSSSFIAITNHDKEDDQNTASHPIPSIDASKAADRTKSLGLQEIIEESTNRLDCIQKKWDAKVRRAQRASRRRLNTQTANCNSTADNLYATKDELIQWLCDFPTTNECTHYSAILDPTNGQVVWARAFSEPLRF